MSMRDKIRESADQRFFAMETLRAVTEWIKATNPLDIFLVSKGKEASTISDEEIRQRIRDWINKSGDLIDKGWSLPNLMLEDAVKVMKMVTKNAEQETTPESE
jgi:hypothetical protein